MEGVLRVLDFLLMGAEYMGCSKLTLSDTIVFDAPDATVVKMKKEVKVYFYDS